MAEYVDLISMNLNDPTLRRSIKIAVQRGGQWTATLTLTATPASSEAGARARLREACLRIAASLGDTPK